MNVVIRSSKDRNPGPTTVRYVEGSWSRGGVPVLSILLNVVTIGAAVVAIGKGKVAMLVILTTTATLMIALYDALTRYPNTMP